MKLIFGLIILSQVASTDFDAAAGKVVEYVTINGHTLASNFSTPHSNMCEGFYPAVANADVLPYITDAVDRLEVRTSLVTRRRDTAKRTLPVRA